MSKFEELYTVDDIAQMTMLTSRTIRNYLKDGLLTGRKIGGQWRFTKKDLENLFSNSAVEEEIKDNRRQEVMDFINGVNTDMDGDIQICTIADYYCNDKNTAKLLSDRFCSVISEQTAPTKHSFNYEYIDKEQKARYTFFGTPMYIKASVSILEDEWKKLNESQMSFTGRSNNYDRYRPSYPNEVLSLIQSTVGRQKISIADIGSGTGKLTEILLESDNEVYAIEPNADMRSESEKKLGVKKNFHSINGVAENTTLMKDSVDVITCAQAYHWFDNDLTLQEFHRIIKPDGYGFLIWNAPGDNPYNKELGETFEAYAVKKAPHTNPSTNEERAKHLFGEGNYLKAEFEHKILEPYEAFRGASLSTSYAPKAGDDNYDNYISSIKAIFDKYSINGLLESKFIAECYYGKL